MTCLPVLIVLAFVSFKATIGLPSTFNPVLDLTWLPNPVVSTAFNINKRTVRDTKEEPHEDFVEKKFKLFDYNGDKKITVSEIKKVWKDHNDVEWSEEEVFKFFDENNDNSFDKQEFETWFDYGESYYQFRLMDADKDSFVTAEEMGTFLRKCGFPDEVNKRQVARNFGKFDIENDKKWKFEEFDEWYMAPEREYAEEDFKALDANSNGSITPEEMAAWYKRIGGVERISHAKLYIDWADENEDGVVDMKEFLKEFYDIW